MEGVRHLLKPAGGWLAGQGAQWWKSTRHLQLHVCMEVVKRKMFIKDHVKSHTQPSALHPKASDSKVNWTKGFWSNLTNWALWEWHSTIYMLGENKALHITTNTPSPSWSMGEGGQQQQEDLLPGKTRMPSIQQTHREGSQSAEWVATLTQAPIPIETRSVLLTLDPQGTWAILKVEEKIVTSSDARMPAED